MKLKISKGNSKIGGVPNIALPPGITCVPKVPCFIEGCYAMKSYRQYPNVRNAWDSNLKLYNEAPGLFFSDLFNWLQKYQPARFRYFVGGDFPNEDFYWEVETIADQFPDTQFLAFTKRYHYNYASRPENLQIILSTWPGWPLPTHSALPWAWLEEDDRKPEAYFRCPGGCDDCGYTCWNAITAGNPVVFPKH